MTSNRKMKILMNRGIKKKYYCLNFIISVHLILAVNLSSGFSQTAGGGEKLYFISDVQAPMLVEKFFLKAYRNEEARDSLFADLKRHHPANIFMLGDLTSRGSDEI